MSRIRKAVAAYLTLRRGLGFKLHREGIWLSQFISFLEEHQSPRITTALALEWATQPTGAQLTHTARRLSVVRGFAQYQAARDPRTEVPAAGLLLQRYHRKPPYIYSDAEIASLLKAAAQLPSKTGLRARTYTTLLGLLIVTGMRIGEVVRLDHHDVDLTHAVLTVRRTKFGKSRLVPLHASTKRALRRYVDERDQISPRRTTTSFLVGEQGQRLTVNTVEQTFVKLSHQVGLRGPSERRGPRLHDLRHRFAVATLLRWYRSGVDVQRHLPELSTYLGHVHVTDTYWYLSAVPELMTVVAARLEPRSGARRA